MKTTTNQSIHTNQLVQAIYCPRRFLYAQNHTQSTILFPLRTEYYEQLEKLVKPFNLVSGQPYDPTERSLEILKAETCGRSLRFEKDGLRTNIPFLFEKQDGTYKAIYPYCSTAPKESLLNGLVIDTMICQACGVEVSEHEFLYLNSSYVRQDNPKPSDFFKITSHLKKKRGGFTRLSATEQIQQKMGSVTFEQLVDMANKLSNSTLDDYCVRRVSSCTRPNKCPYYEECFHEQQLPDYASAFLSSSSSREWIEEKGIERLGDITSDLFEGTPMQYAQIKADQNGGVFMDDQAIRYWMKQIEYPICYLDFEWETFAIPPYVKMKAFDVLCFQYSMHIENEQGELDHKTFFATGDCRKDFIEHLLEDIPDHGSIMVFNMDGAEKLRLRQLANQFPEYRVQLEQVNNRMIDLQAPFENGCFYDLRQRGKSSLKTLMPLFSACASYDQLDIHNGMEAVFAYRETLLENDPCKVQKIGERISDYCSMDTYAERELFLGLKKKLEEL
ncbi:MAG: DUF2779 domain-containing protein [Erysipelotrichaceae bacterium]|nr:DUF2779 domain-containing protein [Erysipelotrichaceae bacterium]